MFFQFAVREHHVLESTHDHVYDFPFQPHNLSSPFHTHHELNGSMPPIHRLLIKTHHMTSRKKILTLTRAASNLQCSVLLKTGPHPPGIMLAEGERAEDWLKAVKVSSQTSPR
jgi:hypothetical protein